MLRRLSIPLLLALAGCATPRDEHIVPFTAEQEFYSTGFGAQGGDPARFPGLAKLYLIMGRSLFAAEDPAKELARVEERLGMGAGA